jgi:hypothetical protein
MGRPVEKPTLSIATREANELIAIDPKRPRASTPPPPPPPPIKPKLAPPLKLASAEPKGDAKNSKQAPPPISVESKAPLDAELGGPDRQVRLLASLTEAIGERGWSGRLRKAPYKITVEGEPLTFELTEQTDCIAHVSPTPTD